VCGRWPAETGMDKNNQISPRIRLFSDPPLTRTTKARFLEPPLIPYLIASESRSLRRDPCRPLTLVYYPPKQAYSQTHVVSASRFGHPFSQTLAPAHSERRTEMALHPFPCNSVLGYVGPYTGPPRGKTPTRLTCTFRGEPRAPPLRYTSSFRGSCESSF